MKNRATLEEADFLLETKTARGFGNAAVVVVVVVVEPTAALSGFPTSALSLALFERYCLAI